MTQETCASGRPNSALSSGSNGSITRWAMPLPHPATDRTVTAPRIRRSRAGLGEASGGAGWDISRLGSRKRLAPVNANVSPPRILGFHLFAMTRAGQTTNPPSGLARPRAARTPVNSDFVQPTGHRTKRTCREAKQPRPDNAAESQGVTHPPHRTAASPPPPRLERLRRPTTADWHRPAASPGCLGDASPTQPCNLRAGAKVAAGTSLPCRPYFNRTGPLIVATGPSSRRWASRMRRSLRCSGRRLTTPIT